MNFYYTNILLYLLFAFLFSQNTTYGQNKKHAVISGNLFLDDSWDSIIYLSYIPTYDDMYLMSNDMIIAKTSIDNHGHFEFDLNFLPPEERLFRLHVIKEGDSPATIIIGGRNENYLFLIANRYSNITISTSFSYPPFKNITFKNSPENMALQKIRNIVFKADSSFSESSPAKRMLIEKILEKDLLTIADTSGFFMVSLFAVYKSNFKNNYSSNIEFYSTYLKKWKNADNPYFKSLEKQLPIQTDNSFVILFIIVFALGLLLILYLFIRKSFSQKRNFKKLSLQERKVFELLREGATNQEISDQCSISISTVKSHVSNLYSKLNIKSRKDIMNFEL